jgi:hypothetical protein
MIVSVSPLNHSPTKFIITGGIAKGSSFNPWRIGDEIARGEDAFTEVDGHLLVGARERVSLGALGQDDERAVEVDAQPGEVRVPPQRAPLVRDGEVVRVALPALDRALRDVRRPVRPPVAQLPDAVPACARIDRSPVVRTAGKDGVDEQRGCELALGAHRSRCGGLTSGTRHCS